jgi:hypothetical protein
MLDEPRRRFLSATPRELLALVRARIQAARHAGSERGEPDEPWRGYPRGW